MTLIDHVHGQANQKCEHPDCQLAWSRYIKRWKYERSHGMKRTIDPSEVTLHVATLLGLGWSCRAIAGAAGVAPQTVTRLKRGDAKSIGRHIAGKILAISPERLPFEASHQTSEPFVPRVGTVRRLQALQAIGWSSTALREFGIDKDNLLNQQGRWVTRSKHDQVAEVYRMLCTRPGPSARSRSRAAKVGYLPPVAWDDIDLDLEPDLDPTDLEPGVDEVAISRRMDGDKTVGLSPAEARRLVERWKATGRPLAECERITGINPYRHMEGAA